MDDVWRKCLTLLTFRPSAFGEIKIVLKLTSKGLFSFAWVYLRCVTSVWNSPMSRVCTSQRVWLRRRRTLLKESFIPQQVLFSLDVTQCKTSWLKIGFAKLCLHFSPNTNFCLLNLFWFHVAKRRWIALDACNTGKLQNPLRLQSISLKARHVRCMRWIINATLAVCLWARRRLMNYGLLFLAKAFKQQSGPRGASIFFPSCLISPFSLHSAFMLCANR